MLEYCSSRHGDPTYRYAGTIDCGIRDVERGMLLMYSIVNMGDQWHQLQIIPPMQFDYFNSVNRIKGKTLKEVFQRGSETQGFKVTTKCVKANSDNLLRLIRKDAGGLTPADLASLETVIAEVFA